MTIEETLRRSLADEASRLSPGPDRWGDVESRVSLARRGRRARTGVLTAVGLVAATILAVVAVPGILDRAADSNTITVDTPPGPGPTTPAPTIPVTTLPPSTIHRAEGYQLLWPFASIGQALEWQATGEPGGHSPWHSDPEATALSFSSGYLGYSGIDRVIASKVEGAEARVTVGYHDDYEGNQDFAAAVIHLVRLGSGDNAPWEVVGTDDTNLTLTAPAYGSTVPVAGTITVGGIISGVDEALDVQFHELGSSEPVARACCPPAGGMDTPWSMPVTYESSGAGVLTIAVSTGGHLAKVERFAVTGVRAAPA